MFIVSLHIRTRIYSFTHTILARSLFQTAESLTSNRVASDDKRDFVLNILRGNNYPWNFLYDCLQAPVGTKCTSSKRDFSKGFALVPYIQRVAEPTRRVLNNCGIKVALKPFQTLGHIFAKPKDRVATKPKTHFVYHVVIERKNI